MSTRGEQGMCAQNGARECECAAVAPTCIAVCWEKEPGVLILGAGFAVTSVSGYRYTVPASSVVVVCDSVVDGLKSMSSTIKKRVRPRRRLLLLLCHGTVHSRRRHQSSHPPTHQSTPLRERLLTNSGIRQRAGLRRRHATASWAYLFRLIKLLPSSSSSASRVPQLRLSRP